MAKTTKAKATESVAVEEAQVTEEVKATVEAPVEEVTESVNEAVETPVEEVVSEEKVDDVVADAVPDAAPEEAVIDEADKEVVDVLQNSGKELEEKLSQEPENAQEIIQNELAKVAELEKSLEKRVNDTKRRIVSSSYYRDYCMGALDGWNN